MLQSIQPRAAVNCPRCRQPLRSVDIAAFPPNYDLEETIANLQRSYDLIQANAINPDDLQLTNVVIGRGAYGVVRDGWLTFRGCRLQVSLCSRIASARAVGDSLLLTLFKPLPRCAGCC